MGLSRVIGGREVCILSIWMEWIKGNCCFNKLMSCQRHLLRLILLPLYPLSIKYSMSIILPRQDRTLNLNVPKFIQPHLKYLLDEFVQHHNKYWSTIAVQKFKILLGEFRIFIWVLIWHQADIRCMRGVWKYPYLVHKTLTSSHSRVSSEAS